MDFAGPYLYTVTNEQDQTTAVVVANPAGGFNVALRDDDSGKFVPLVMMGIRTLDEAKERAYKIANPSGGE